MSDSIRFNVGFYNDSHRDALRGTSIYDDVVAVTQTGITIPYGEFAAYAIFQEQSGDVGYTTFTELQNHLSKFLPPYEEYYQRSGETIYLRRTQARQQGRHQTEMGGVGAALAIASSLYRLTEADWQRIPESREKDLDFMRINPRLASNGKAFIQLEAKGHAADVPDLKSNLSADVRDIAEKKQAQRKKNLPATEFLGIITTFPTSPDDQPQSWIVDPPFIPIVEDPRKLRLLKRLYFYWKALGPISNRFGIALINRIYAIARSRAYQEFDGDFLLTYRGNAVKALEAGESIGTQVQELDAFGEIMPLNDGSLFFYGLDRTIFTMLVDQVFQDIIEYRKGEAILREVTMTARLRKRNLGPEFHNEIGSSTVEIRAKGSLYATSAGRIYGRVSVDHDELAAEIRSVIKRDRRR